MYIQSKKLSYVANADVYEMRVMFMLNIVWNSVLLHISSQASHPPCHVLSLHNTFYFPVVTMSNFLLECYGVM